MSDDSIRHAILSAGPDDGDWTDVLRRVILTRHRRQVYGAVLLSALVIVGAASAYALTHRGHPWCKAPTSEAWKRALASHVVDLSRRVSVTPLAVADDGHSFYAELVSKSYSGIVRIDARTSHFLKIQRIPRPDMFQADGSADGRWFVWVDAWRDKASGPDYPKWEMWSWDSRTGRLRKIAAEQNAALDGDWQPAFSVGDGYAVWSQSVSGMDSDLHAVNLSTGRDRVVYHGSVQATPLLLPGHTALWNELIWEPSGKTVKLAAVNALTGKRVVVPRTVRGLRGSSATSFATDGRAFIYLAPLPRHSLYSAGSLLWSPSLATKPWRIFTLRRGMIGAELAGRYVLFSTDTYGEKTGARRTTYLGDATTSSYVKISSSSGGALLGNKALVLKEPPALKEPSPAEIAKAVTGVTFLPVESFPAIRSCPSQ